MNTSALSAEPLLVSNEYSIAAIARYRADLDGLRALAALSVVVAHVFPRLSGGVTGVDMFFVLSGYLISGILLRSLLQDGVSFSDFYARRVKRIFPALLVVLSSVWVVGSLLLLPDEYRKLGKDIATSAAFSLNVFWQLEHNFHPFEADVSGDMLTHLWSLGVEEQFYLLWPLFLLAIWKLSGGRIRCVTLAVAIVMFISLGFLVLSDNGEIGLIPWRGWWALSGGGLLACIHLGRPFIVPKFLALHRVRALLRWVLNRHVLGLTAAALLSYGIASGPSDPLFNNSWTLAPAIGTMLLIVAGPESLLNKYIFGSSCMAFIGKISYPLYLWHFPVIFFLAIVWDRSSPGGMFFAIVTATSLVLAFLTYRFVEAPIRFTSRKTTTVVTLLCLMVACGGIGVAVFLGGMRPVSFFSRGDLFQSISEDWLSNSGKYSWTRFPDRMLTLGDGSRRALFIGDSNMQQYYPRIEKLFSGNVPLARGAIFATRFGCAPGIVETHVSDREEALRCRQELDRALSYAADPSVDIVVIAAAWYANLVEINDWNSIGQMAPFKPKAEMAFRELSRTISALQGSGKRVYLLLNIPVGLDIDPRVHINRMERIWSRSEPGLVEPSKSNVVVALQPISSRLREIALASGAAVIDPVEFLCKGESCSLRAVNGEWMYHDRWHLRPSYVREDVRYLDHIVLNP